MYFHSHCVWLERDFHIVLRSGLKQLESDVHFFALLAQIVAIFVVGLTFRFGRRDGCSTTLARPYTWLMGFALLGVVQKAWP